ncbi:hypothetical protein [Rhizobium wenxiniae]|uniref:hypothetical protein n=1 Tax=Rhizobium wenxiniae TaxID=1737357 RepID=UPI003C1B99A4
MTIASGCVHNDGRLTAAAEKKGVIAAKIQIDPLPAECWGKTPRVYPRFGVEKPRNTQLRWEMVADNQDRLKERCQLLDEERSRLLSGQSIGAI